MRRSALPILIVACVVVAAVLAWLAVGRLFPTITTSDSSEPATSEIRTPGKFSKVDASGHLDIELVQGPRHEVVVEAAPDEQDRVRTRVEGSTLTISVGRGGSWRPFRGAGRTPRVIVTAPSFESVAASGTMKIHAASLDVPSLRVAASGSTSLAIDKLTTDSLRLAGSGAVKAELAGRARELTVAISGAGDVLAGALATEDGKVSVSGAGHVVVNAEKTLRVSLSGAGSVEYYGNPELKQSISGIGNVKRREGTPANAPAAPMRYRIA